MMARALQRQLLPHPPRTPSTSCTSSPSPRRASQAAGSGFECSSPRWHCPSCRKSDAGGNCIKIGLPGKLILRDYFQENRTSRRPFLLPRISFPGISICIQFAPGGFCIKIGLPGKLILSKRKGLWEVIFCGK